MKKIKYEILTGLTSGMTYQLPVFLEASVDEMGIMVGFDGDIEQVDQFCNFTYMAPEISQSAPNITPTRTPSKTPSVSVSITPSISILATVTPSLSITATPSLSISRTATPSLSISRTATPSLSMSRTVTPSSSISRTPSLSVSITPTPSPSLPGGSASPTPSMSISPTQTPSTTPTLTMTQTISMTPTMTQTISMTPTVTQTISTTPTMTQTISTTPTVTQTISTTPTVTQTPTATPSTSMAIYYKCADNGFHFNGYSSGLLGLLTVGDVHITGATLTDYVIEWRLNSTSGSIVFITGNSGNTDPSIQAFHPLVSELVQAGTLYPVIRYANVNGVNYSAYSNLGYLYSPDLLTCLPSIIVTSMSCSNGATGTTWGHNVSYTNTTQPSHLANRSLTYTLNYDGSSKYISYRFMGYLVADRITLTYCTTGGTTTVMDDWVVGTDCTGTTYNTTPKLYDAQYLNRTLALTGFTYTYGDYLLFNTYPSYNVPGNKDTNWQLQIKCWSDPILPDFGFAPAAVNDINTGATMTLVYNTGNCTYQVAIETGVPTKTLSYNTDMYIYMTSQGYGTWDWSSGQTISIPQYTGSTVSWVPGTGYGTPYLLNGVLNMKLTGGTHNLVYTFTDGIDYYHYKNGYTANTLNIHWTDWTSDVNNINHYKLFRDRFRVSMTSGDTGYENDLYIDYESVFTFDDTARTISIALQPQQAQYTGVTCDRSNESLASWCTWVNQVYSGITWNLNTIWGTQYPFSFLYNLYYTFGGNIGYAITIMGIPPGLVDDSTPLSPEWYLYGGSIGMWYFYKIYARLRITNPADPLNNYEIHTGINLDGSISNPVVWRLIKSVP